MESLVIVTLMEPGALVPHGSFTPWYSLDRFAADPSVMVSHQGLDFVKKAIWHGSCYVGFAISTPINAMNAHMISTLSQAPSDLAMGDEWDTFAIAELVRMRSSYDTCPAFLILGKVETEILRQHLSGVFGEESVATMHSLYYMGLEVLEVEKECYLRVAGTKVVRTLQDPIARRQAWRQRENDSLWHLRIA